LHVVYEKSEIHGASEVIFVHVVLEVL